MYQHIKDVVKFSKKLADKNVVEEVVVIASWFHDIASVTDEKFYPHHIHGAKMAEKILKEFDYEEDKIKKIQGCILHHRGSYPKEKENREEEIVADADSLAHFFNVGSLYYLAFSRKKYSEEEGEDFVLQKLKRSYKKISPKTKKIYGTEMKELLKILEMNRRDFA